ncbi:hypothetical protein PR001_g30791 [Phytophthora rubi]|uniref:Uncharacterized protein n=1 Tax=Phytophthora rubi TaxID=129364 RepID=A0A6A3GPP3_9STRA|nr:hypothetical protein PR001_g30791 [Phytophthora rubi]
MGGGVSGATLRWPTLVWAATTAGFGIGTGPGIRPLDWYWFWEKLYFEIATRDSEI